MLSSSASLASVLGKQGGRLRAAAQHKAKQEVQGLLTQAFPRNGCGQRTPAFAWTISRFFKGVVQVTKRKTSREPKGWEAPGTGTRYSMTPRTVQKSGERASGTARHYSVVSRQRDTVPCENPNSIQFMSSPRAFCQNVLPCLVSGTNSCYPLHLLLCHASNCPVTRRQN